MKDIFCISLISCVDKLDSGILNPISTDRFYDDIGLIYGRTHSVNPQDGEGICLAKVTRGTTKAITFILITYIFPILSAKAVPDLQAWAKEWSEYFVFCIFIASSQEKKFPRSLLLMYRATSRQS